jgi:tetratricopeptide (TPR) repeat protein
MGSAYQLKGDFVEAEAHIRRAATIFQRFSDLYGLISIYRNLGVIYLAQKNWSDALANLKSALETSRSLQARADEAQTIVHLAEYEIARGNQRQAWIWLNQVENLLNQHPESGYYYQLPKQIEKICRSLNDNDRSSYGISTTPS